MVKKENNIYVVSIIAIVAIVGIVALMTFMGTGSSYSYDSEGNLIGEAFIASKRIAKPIPITPIEPTIPNYLVDKESPSKYFFEIEYSDIVLKTDWQTTRDRTPVIDGNLDSWELENTDSALNIKGYWSEHHNIYTKLVGNNIYVAIKMEGLQHQCEELMPELGDYLKFVAYFEEGNESQYGSGELNEMFLPDQEDAKVILLVGDGTQHRCDGYYNEDYNEGELVRMWNSPCESWKPEQINFEGKLGFEQKDDGCSAIIELLVPLEGIDGVYTQDIYFDHSDLTIDEGYFGMTYELNPPLAGGYYFMPEHKFFKIYVDSAFKTQELSTR